MNRERRLEKIQMKKTLRIHDQKNTKQKDDDKTPEGTIPTYLVEREGHNRAKVLSNMIKQKRKEKAGKWSVPIPKVRAQSEADVFKVIQTGKRKKKSVEEKGNNVHLRAGYFHPQAAKVREVHPPHGHEDEKGSRDPPRAQDHLLSGHHRS